MKTIFVKLAIALAAASSLVACNNSRLTSKTGLSTTQTAPPQVSTLAGDSYTIANITMTGASAPVPAPSGIPTTSSMQANIYFDTTKSTAPISNHCSSTQNTASTKPCQCMFTWQEVNSTSGTSLTIPRTVYTDVTLVQPSLAACSAPAVYATEIPDGTTIKISVVPAAGSTEAFTMAPYNFLKTSGTGAGSFQDAQGRAFSNILRYSCYDQMQRGMDIVNFMVSTTNGASGEQSRLWPVANHYCVQKISATGAPTTGCDTLPGPDYSTQSSFYNLYTRDSEVGGINPSNGRYTCPLVKESLGNNNTIGTQGKYWPLDSSFALSLGRTTDFSIGVVANTKVSNAADPTSVSTTCDGTQTTSTATGNSLVTSCLGFAAKPNPDGTCPYIRDSSGTIRLTYRLRRYVALYPPVFDTNGKPSNQPQATDTIYVLDRPVNSATNPDPLKPFTMRGPKPCPFAYFDHRNVVNGNVPLYAATNDSGWNGKNVDGIQFPNSDTANSCSAALPLLSPDLSILTLGTVNVANSSLNPLGGNMQKIFVRPGRAWAPHYEEDTDFQACAPQSNAFRDPPLHFAKNMSTGNVAWCAEAYPTQNDNLSGLDPNLSKLTVTSAPPSESANDLTFTSIVPTAPSPPNPAYMYSTASQTITVKYNYTIALSASPAAPAVATVVSYSSGSTDQHVQTITATYTAGTLTSSGCGTVAGAYPTMSVTTNDGLWGPVTVTATVSAWTTGAAFPCVGVNDKPATFTFTGSTGGLNFVITSPASAGPTYNPTLTTGNAFQWTTTGDFFSVTGSASGTIGNATRNQLPAAIALNDPYGFSEMANTHLAFTLTPTARPLASYASYVLSATSDPSQPNTGSVRPFTSHVAKNSASADCIPTIPSSATAVTYPASGLGHHLGPSNSATPDRTDTMITNEGATQTPLYADKSCDRTVVNGNGAAWKKFPLLAPAVGIPGSSWNQGVEDALASTADPSFACMVTFDNGGSKTGKLSPTQGCCGPNVRVWTGLGVSGFNDATNAHLEPDAPCLVPQY